MTTRIRAALLVAGKPTSRERDLAMESWLGRAALVARASVVPAVRERAAVIAWATADPASGVIAVIGNPRAGIRRSRRRGLSGASGEELVHQARSDLAPTGATRSSAA